MKRREQLSAIEASFLALERRGAPMHVGGLVTFIGSPPLTTHELEQLVVTRLRRVVRFHQRPRFRIGRRPEWERVGRINLSAHIFRHELPPPGRPTQLRKLCSEIHEQLLERDRPLWEMHLIDGMPGGQQALLVKTHHAITDGIAGIDLADMLFDPARGARKPQLKRMRFVDQTTPSAWTALQGLVGLAYTASGGLLAKAGPFNGPVSGAREFATATLPMHAVMRVKQGLGVTIDDVLVATVAAGISSYLRDVRHPETPVALRAMLPVSMRGSEFHRDLRNSVSAIFIDLPMNLDDVPAIVTRITESKATLRTAHAAAGTSMAVQMAARLPAPFHSALLRLVSGLPFANLVVSDVPGPDQDLYIRGRRITGCYPMMPLAPDVGLAIAMVTMDGVVDIGVTADPSLVPGVQHLAKSIERALTNVEQQPAARRAA